MLHLENKNAASQETPPSSLGSIVCAAMSHDHKKALALELARCQMEDSGRALFDPNNATGCSRPMTSTKILHTCLSQMTDAGLNAYLHSFSHVHQSCIRLTEERLIQASHVATEQLHAMLAHQSEMMQASHVATDQLHAMLAYQSEMWAKREEHEREREMRDKEIRKQHEKMLENLWSKSEEQNNQMLELTKNVEATAEKMKPLFGIESFVTLATNGITWLTSLIHFLAMMNAVWLLTLSKRHDKTRSYMFRMACAETLLEFAMHWMVSQGLLSDVDRVRGISTLRTWILVSEGGAYMVGLILSFFRTSSKEGDALNEAMLRHIEMMQIVNANAEKLRKEALEREQRATQPVVPRTHHQVGGYHSIGNQAETSPGVVSLPPMYSLPRSGTSLGASYSKEQSYEMAYHEALRILLAHTPQQYVVFPQETVDSPPQLCEQVTFHGQSNNPTKDPLKRSHEENDEDFEEPEKKRLKQ